MGKNREREKCQKKDETAQKIWILKEKKQKFTQYLILNNKIYFAEVFVLLQVGKI